MQYLIYLSAGTKWFSETELNAILAISQVINSRDNITGLLLYGDGNFIQLLEGEEEIIQKTFERISTDDRHNSITHVAGGELDTRNFPQWAMGFKSIDASGLKNFKGYLKSEIKNEIANSNGHISITLLNAFIRTARL